MDNVSETWPDQTPYTVVVINLLKANDKYLCNEFSNWVGKNDCPSTQWLVYDKTVWYEMDADIKRFMWHYPDND